MGNRAQVPRLPALALATALTLSPAACTPFGPCFQDQILVSFDGTVQAGGVPQGWTPRGMVTITNLDPPLYQRLVAALIDNSGSAAGAVWTLDTGFGDQMAFLAVLLGVDPQAGDVLEVTGAFQGGGWGFLAPAGGGAMVAARIDDFDATAASGTLTVQATTPLRLVADLTVSDGTGETYRFQGTMTFAREVEEVTCD